ncbi:MAG: aminotransferase class III-fold pyridoxal phosphate-dependent enzyme [Spirochaetia bacterium]|nr:aminotransferase class III-fold pyridoxal phosphate-dependent enzyme [Spirochaetia bacterium]
MSLHSEQFEADPGFREAREQILGAFASHQKGIDGIRPPDPERLKASRDTMQSLSGMRGTDLFYPYLGSGFGRGPFVELIDGSVKYDFIAGIGVHFLGHGHPAVVRAALDGALRSTVMQGNLQQNVETHEFMHLLLSAANRGSAEMDHCFLTTSGAMANENALKIAFQAKAPADRVLAFESCFAGRTLALSHVTDKPAYRKGLPPTLSVDYVPFFDYRDPEGSTHRALKALERHIERYPGRHAAMICELVQGEGGFYPGSPQFFTTLMQALSQKKIPIIVDEIQTFGRTTHPFVFQHFGLDRFVDIVTVGKLTQVCATLFRGAFKPGPGLLSQTFTASTSAISCGTAILKELLHGDYYGTGGRIEHLHNYMVHALDGIAVRSNGKLGGPYGIGAMIAFRVLDGSEETSKRFTKQLFENGVISFTSGRDPVRLRFLLPAGAVTEKDIDAVAAIVESTLSSFEPA